MRWRDARVPFPPARAALWPLFLRHSRGNPWSLAVPCGPKAATDYVFYRLAVLSAACGCWLRLSRQGQHGRYFHRHARPHC